MKFLLGHFYIKCDWLGSFVCRVYDLYLVHLTKLIELRREWIEKNEPRLQEDKTTDALDIVDLQTKLDQHEVRNLMVFPC